MSESKSRARCYCIIPHPSQASILARRAGDGYEIPSVPLPWLRLRFFPDHVPHIRWELRRETKLDVTVLRHLLDVDDLQVCLLEVQSEVAGPPDGCLWLDSQEGAGAKWADERSRQAWQAWSASTADPPALAPWERAGWFADAKLWVQARLRDAGYELRGPVDQIKGAWGWSSILKAETDRGAVYFKADYDKPPKEAAVILKLAERWPRNVPHIIASDAERNWMLLSDFGAAGLETLGNGHFQSAVSLFAEVQRSTAPDVDGWRLLGCPDMTPENLRLTRRLMADPAALCGEELRQLELRVPQMEQMLAQLSSSALPDTISNEDFKPGNVAVCGGEYIFYDWGNTVITHPMFGINYFLNRMPRPASEDSSRWCSGLEDAARRALMSAFLDQWTNYASWDQLSAEFWLCRRLYPLYEAVKSYCDIPYVGTSSPWGAGSLAHIPQAVRNLMTALDYPAG